MGSDIIFNSRFTTGRDTVWTSLRPHEVDPWVILIKSNHQLEIPYNMNIILTVPTMIIVCSVVRRIFRVVTNCPQQDIGSVLLVSSIKSIAD